MSYPWSFCHVDTHFIWNDNRESKSGRNSLSQFLPVFAAVAVLIAIFAISNSRNRTPPQNTASVLPDGPRGYAAIVEMTVPDGVMIDFDTGKKIGWEDMPQFPKNNVCAVTDFVGGGQDFQEEVLNLVDGSTQTLPAATYKLEYTNFNVVNSTKVPGTAFTSDVKLTEGACVAEYKAVGFWPEIGCSNDPSEGALVTSTECDPNADLDAGRVFGSGINPAFEPKCDTALGVCVPTVDVATIK